MKKERVTNQLLAKHQRAKIPAGLFVIMAWIVVNVLFMILELTVLNDTADLNNSVLLVLWLSSLFALVSMKKWGAAFTNFALVYAFSFNAFNIIYFPSTFLLNGVSAILNAFAVFYVFKSIFANKFN